MANKDKALEILKGKTAIVFAGGGVLGKAFVGSLFALEELGVYLNQFTSVSGSSVGSILATALACKATTKYIKDVVNNMDFERFRDHDCILRSAVQVLTKYGLNEKTAIEELASKVLIDLVGDKDITFKELYDKTGVHLTITYLSLNYSRTLYADYINEPNSSVREAIVKSSTIPLFYEAHFEHHPRPQGKGKDKHVACDGGTANNYPMNIPREQKIDPKDILGLKLIASNEMDSIDNGGPGLALRNEGPPNHVIDYLTKIIIILRNQALRIHVDKNDWMLTVKINVGKLSSTDFQITEIERDWLYNQGKNAVYKYLEDLEKLLDKDEFPYV